MKKPTVSVLVTLFKDRTKQFELSLYSLTKQMTGGLSFELLVMIDCPDKAEERAYLKLLKRYRSFFTNIRVYSIEREDNSVFHSASRRNFLVKRARGQYVLFSEPEMFFISENVSLIYKQIARRNKNEWYCGPVYATEELVNKKGEITVDQPANALTVERTIAQVCHKDLSLESSDFTSMFTPIDGHKYEPLFFCTLIHRDFFKEVGGLAQNLRVRGWEELEFYKRFKRAGGVRRYDPRFVTCHLPHLRSLQSETQIAWNVFNSTVEFDSRQSFGKIAQKYSQKII